MTRLIISLFNERIVIDSWTKKYIFIFNFKAEDRKKLEIYYVFGIGMRNMKLNIKLWNLTTNHALCHSQISLDSFKHTAIHTHTHTPMNQNTMTIQ